MTRCAFAMVQRGRSPRADARTLRAWQDQPERAGVQQRQWRHQAAPVRSDERHLLPNPERATASGSARGGRPETRLARGQSRTGSQAGSDRAHHVAHQDDLPRGRDGLGSKTDLTLIVGTTECAHPERARWHDSSPDCGNARAHHFDPPDPDRKPAAQGGDRRENCRARRAPWPAVCSAIDPSDWKSPVGGTGTPALLRDINSVS